MCTLRPQVLIGRGGSQGREGEGREEESEGGRREGGTAASRAQRNGAMQRPQENTIEVHLIAGWDGTRRRRRRRRRRREVDDDDDGYVVVDFQRDCLQAISSNFHPTSIPPSLITEQ
ncbi:hypothetical protein ONZ45_g4711 [Pleurotus djamor]|nr:hypothetical protein ONZ45_g4711 [Pleurotus djamor]